MDEDFSYMLEAKTEAKNSTCLRRHVGAIIVKDNKIISRGSNGACRDLDKCKTCLRIDNNIKSGTKLEYCYAAHAEMNAILSAKCDLEGSTIYTTLYPCTYCAKMIVQAGIKKIVYIEDYDNELTKEILKNLEVVQFS